MAQTGYVYYPHMGYNSKLMYNEFCNQQNLTNYPQAKENIDKNIYALSKLNFQKINDQDYLAAREHATNVQSEFHAIDQLTKALYQQKNKHQAKESIQEIIKTRYPSIAGSLTFLQQYQFPTSLSSTYPQIDAALFAWTNASKTLVNVGNRFTNDHVTQYRVQHFEAVRLIYNHQLNVGKKWEKEVYVTTDSGKRESLHFFYSLYHFSDEQSPHQQHQAA